MSRLVAARAGLEAHEVDHVRRVCARRVIQRRRRHFSLFQLQQQRGSTAGQQG